jgi:putative ABC transport system ATP-binding protein
MVFDAMSDPAILLEARNIQRSLADGPRLLDNVSLQLRAGARLSITGASGSGKTLLLRALAVLDPVDSGQVLWQGRPVAHERVPRYRRQAVYLHQRPAMLDHHVEAALRRPFRLAAHRGRRFERERIVGWLGQLGRDGGFLAKQTRDLSGGEIQLVALLRAIQLDPAVLLLDEPTAAIDSATTQAIEQWLCRWVDEPNARRAFLWVTHDEAQAPRVAETTLHMAYGRITDRPETSDASGTNGIS